MAAGLDDTYVDVNYVADWENPLFARLGLAGTDLSMRWWSSWRTTWSDAAAALAAEPDGSALYAGGSSSGPEPGLWVRRLAPDGKQAWGSRLTRSGADEATALALGDPGELIVAGTRMVNGSQPLLASLDRATGAPRWMRTVSVPEGVVTVTDLARDATALAVDRCGRVFVAGWTEGALAPGATARRRDAYVAQALLATVD